MNAVHARCDDELVQPAFQADREPEIAVMKKRSRLEDQFIEEKHPEGRTNQNHLGDAKQGGEEDLTEMETKTGGDIESRIDVVNIMEAPEHRNPVVKDMPVIEAEIEQEKGEDELGPNRQLKEMQQAELLCGRPIQSGERRGADDEHCHEKHEAGQNAIHEKAGKQSCARGAERKPFFHGKQQKKYGEDRNRRVNKQVHIIRQQTEYKRL